MSEWETQKLDNMLMISKSQFKPNNHIDMHYIGLEHIDAEKLRLNGVGSSLNVASNKFYFEKNDILFGKLRPYFRKVIQAKFAGVCSTDIWVIRAKKEINQSYLFYFLANWEFIDLANSGESGSRMPRADWNFLKNTEWQIPPLPEQKAIADVLSALDDKIDLLHRQNHTLEKMTETLFRQWFVEEVQEDWEEVELKNFGTIVCGKTPSKKELDFYGNNIPFLKIPDMHGKTFILKTEDNLSYKGANSQSKKFIPANSICVSCIATVGLVCITSRELQTNQQINSIILSEDKYLYYLYSVMKSLYDELNALASGGTATLNLNTGDFSKIKIALPNDLILQKFNELAIPLFEKIKTNSQQIQTLETLRDTLLPKLISGEVRVNVQAA